MPRSPQPKKEQPIANTPEVSSESHTPLIFVSHDSKDSELAEAFGKLVSSVSAGVLKIFRSSDKKGSQGIEYGVEWYPKLMQRLSQASDVVCLLTENSIDRPWILYEAGVAKGKLDTPLYGIALGIPLSQANSGPFAQFQNCDDEEESLTKLVMQLVQRIPGSEPDHDTVLMQVQIFKQSVKKSIALAKKGTQETTKPMSEESTSKLFEEIKIMFSELSDRIEKRISGSGRSQRTISPEVYIDLGEYLIRSRRDPNGILVLFSIFRDGMPWFYEVGVSFWEAVKSRNQRKADIAFREFRKMADTAMSTHLLERFDISPRTLDVIHRNLEFFLSDYIPRAEVRPGTEEKGHD